VTGLKQAAADEVARRADALVELSHAIHARAEPACSRR
jgi:hypothetical protein